MSDQQILEFPCAITVKAFGYADADLEAVVLDIVRRHFDGLTADAVSTKPSKKGKYLSVNVAVVAQSREQMDAVYQDLVDCEHVLMAL